MGSRVRNVKNEGPRKAAHEAGVEVRPPTHPHSRARMHVHTRAHERAHTQQCAPCTRARARSACTRRMTRRTRRMHARPTARGTGGGAERGAGRARRSARRAVHRVGRGAGAARGTGRVGCAGARVCRCGDGRWRRRTTTTTATARRTRRAVQEQGASPTGGQFRACRGRTSIRSLQSRLIRPSTTLSTTRPYAVYVRTRTGHFPKCYGVRKGTHVPPCLKTMARKGSRLDMKWTARPV